MPFEWGGKQYPTHFEVHLQRCEKKQDCGVCGDYWTARQNQADKPVKIAIVFKGVDADDDLEVYVLEPPDNATRDMLLAGHMWFAGVADPDDHPANLVWNYIEKSGVQPTDETLVGVEHVVVTGFLS